MRPRKERYRDEKEMQCLPLMLLKGNESWVYTSYSPPTLQSAVDSLY